MTSKNSFFNILKIAIKGRMWGIALSCIGFFFAFPIYSALCVGTIKDRIARSVFRPGIEYSLFARDALGENNFLVMAGVVLIGLFLAFNGFSYLYSKSKVDLFHSTPVKRETIFAAEYLAGLLTYFVPYVVFMLMAIIVGAVNGMVDGRGIGSALLMLMINLLGFLAVYNTTIIAIVLTGNIAVGIIGTAVLFLYSLIINVLLMGYRAAFFITSSDYGNGIDFGLVKYLSPIAMYINSIDGMGSFLGVRNLSGENIFILLAYGVITLALGLVLFRMRNSEATGKSMAFKKSMPVISVMLLVPISLAGGIIFKELTNRGMGNAYGWFIFGFVATLILGHCVVQAIYYLDFKSLCKNLINPAIAGVAGAFIALIFILDLFGYDRFVPAEASIESAGIASYAMQGDVEYFNFDVEADEYGSHGVGVDLMEYRLDNVKITDKTLIQDIAKAGIEDSKTLYDLQQTVYYAEDDSAYYDESIRYAAITVKYNMKNGKTKYRNYNIKMSDRMDLYERIYGNEEYKKIACPMMEMDPADAADIAYVGPFDNEGFTFSDTDIDALVKAYKADVAEQDAYSMSNEIPYGYICKQVSIAENGYVSLYNTNKAYIYPSFKRTVAILEKYGINTNYYRDVENISSLIINNYSAMSENGEASSVEITDKKEIAEILENSYPSDLTYTESLLWPVEPVDIIVNMKDSPYGVMYQISYNCLKGKLPKFVAERIEL